MIIALIFAFLNRCRGGFIPLGSTFKARIYYWVIPNTLAAAYYLHTHNISLIWTAIIALGVWAASTIPHGKWFGSSEWKDVSVMGLIGILQAYAVLMPFTLFYPSFYPLVLIGASNGAAYYIGWKYLNGVRFRIRKTLIAENGAEWGEILTGAARGLMFIILGIV